MTTNRQLIRTTPHMNSLPSAAKSLPPEKVSSSTLLIGSLLSLLGFHPDEIDPNKSSKKQVAERTPEALIQQTLHRRLTMEERRAKAAEKAKAAGLNPAKGINNYYDHYLCYPLIDANSSVRFCENGTVRLFMNSTRVFKPLGTKNLAQFIHDHVPPSYRIK